VAIAIVSSFVALAAVPRIHDAAASSNRTNLWALVFGLSLGAGIWTMHFIAMLALNAGLPVRYDGWLTLLSLLVGVGFSTLGILPLRRGGRLGEARLLGMGGLMGIGIAGMHYTGMAAMQMAARAGITVPEIRLAKVNNTSVYLIKRFDRSKGLRIPFMSGHAVSNLDLEELEKGSYILLAQAMRKFVSHVDNDLHELFRRMVFNIYIRNQDDHLRNHGFIYTENGWQLSPLYDVLPIPARHTKNPFSLSLAIGNQGSTATMSNIYSRHQQFNLTKQEATEIISHIAEATVDWENVLRENDVSQTDIEAVRWSFEGFRTIGAKL